MKIIIALDSFKGVMSAQTACARVAAGIRCACPDAECVEIPMADGGEGTAAALLKACGGTWIPRDVMGPLPEMNVRAGIALLHPINDKNETVAVVEMATASGITLLPPDTLNPLRTTTYGTGTLLQAAMESGAQRILLTAGGSATVDGGTGAAAALGWKFLDDKDKPIALGGGALRQIARIIPPVGHPHAPIQVLCDVDHPLIGPHGAARVFGPQKGATPEMVDVLEAGLTHLADQVQRQTGLDIATVPGAGAAGGLAGGLLAFADAQLVRGIDTVMALSGLDHHLTGADWVITGEGRFDAPSLRGKVVSGITRLADRHGVAVAVLAGSIQMPEKSWQTAGIAYAASTAAADTPFEQARLTAEADLTRAARRFALHTR